MIIHNKNELYSYHRYRFTDILIPKSSKWPKVDLEIKAKGQI
jgi:hypothetical protein